MNAALLAAAACLPLLTCAAALAGASPPQAPSSLAPPATPVASPAPAQVAGHPAPLSLLEDPDARLARNKRMVFDLWRGIVNAGHIELADTLLTEGYTQHSPVLPTGRTAFKKIFSVVPRKDIPALVSPPLVTILAEGNLVVMALREEIKASTAQPGYTTTHFNLFRVDQDRLAEHWHSVREAPGENVLPPEKGGPQPITGTVGSAQYALLGASDTHRAANKRLVYDVWRQLVEGRREELAPLYLSEDFIDHDPNGASGRAGFSQRIAARRDAPIPVSVSAPVVAMVAQGDLVVMVLADIHPHPVRAGATYTTASFEMFRIANGRIAEHWNGNMRQAGAGDAW